MQLRRKFAILAVCGALTLCGCRPTETPSANLPPPLVSASIPQFAAAPTKPSGPPWFTEVTASTGIDFRHDSGTNPEKPFPAANGSGVAALDYDLDGHCDLYFANGAPFPLSPGGKSHPDQCFRNLGQWRFRNATVSCGLTHTGYSAGVAVGDYDSDGFPDLYVTCYGPNVLFHNCGDGTFEARNDAGVADERWGASAAFFDADNDGLLDLYVCNYAKWSWEERLWCGDEARNLREYCSPHSVEPEDDVLFRNGGDGRFDDATAAMGLARPPARGQGVVAADLDGNGLCDLYVGNDLQLNFLFLNRGEGTFDDASESSGAGYDYQGRAQAGMGVDAADVNGDGRPELFVTNFSNEHNTLYDNLGSGIFQDATMQRGAYTESLPYIGWGAAVVDFNLDTWPDLVVTNGPLKVTQPDTFPPLLWRNTQGRFQAVGPEGGDYFRSAYAGRGLAVADLDNDGDADVIVGHHDGPPAILANQRLASRTSEAASVTLRLVGARSNRDCVGASIQVAWGDKSYLALVKGGGSYLSAHDLRQVLAVPADAESLSCQIQWPGGERSHVDNLRPGKSYVIIQPTSSTQSSLAFETPQ